MLSRIIVEREIVPANVKLFRHAFLFFHRAPPAFNLQENASGLPFFGRIQTIDLLNAFSTVPGVNMPAAKSASLAPAFANKGRVTPRRFVSDFPFF
jgi:hypothetical protein